jgi:hypothetical protein
MSKHLAIAMRTRVPARAAGRGKGWPPERRARQAARARLMQPWRHSTGPRTEAGKARVAMNALRHGCRSRAWRLKAQRIRRAIRICANTVLLARLLVRQRDRHAPTAMQGYRIPFPSLEKGGSNCLEQRERQFGEGSSLPVTPVCGR